MVMKGRSLILCSLLALMLVACGGEAISEPASPAEISIANEDPAAETSDTANSELEPVEMEENQGQAEIAQAVATDESDEATQDANETTEENDIQEAAADEDGAASEQSAPCSDSAEFIDDVTIPDNVTIEPGQSFVKTWRLRNTGTCPWTSHYMLTFSGDDPMQATEVFPFSNSVAEGETVDLSLQLTAPLAPGTHKSTWQLQNTSGELFGGRYYALIVVPDLAADLVDELSFFSGGGIPSACREPRRSARVEMLSVGFGFGNLSFLCIYGMPLNEAVTLSLSDPSGREFEPVSFIAVPEEDGFSSHTLTTLDGQPLGNASDAEAQTVMELYVWDSAQMLYGQWQAAVQSDSLAIDESFPVILETENYVTVGANGDYEPFGAQRSSYAAGDAVPIYGSGFEPETSIPLGIYYTGAMSEGDGMLVYATVIRTDERGRFTHIVPIMESDLSGTYQIALGTDEVNDAAETPSLFYGQGRFYRIEHTN